MWSLGNLPCQRFAHIAGQPGVDAGLAQNVVDEHGGGCLAVGAGDAHHAGIGVAAGQLDFGDYGNGTFAQFHNQGGIEGYAGRFHYLVGVEDKLLGVTSLFIGDAAAVEFGGVAGGDGAHIGEKHVHAELFAEDRGAYAALAAAEHHQACAGSLAESFGVVVLIIHVLYYIMCGARGK